MISTDLIRTATKEQLQHTRDLIVGELDKRRTEEVSETRFKLTAGTRCKTYGLSPNIHNGKMVTVKVIHKTRATVLFDGEKLPCRVPISCLEIVD